MEPATPFATGEKIYNESKKPTKSFGQLLLSLIVMQKTSTLQCILRKFGYDIFNNDENISKMASIVHFWIWRITSLKY